MTDHTCAETCTTPPGASLCPKSPTYWRRAENRESGVPYREVTLDEAYGSLDRSQRRR